MVEGRLGESFDVRTRAAARTLKQPLARNRKAAKLGVSHRVFCASLSGLFDAEMPGTRERLFELIRATPWLIWLLLSKRIGNAPDMLPPFWDEIKDRCVIMATMAADRVASRVLDMLEKAHERQAG
ncbi:DUF5131 family protein [Azospirillum argentinense]|uniref:DUF5131 family protein n=1 Tax=Azospirillum argentinense TaxID=2970906 RepID=UPI001FFF72B8|nr:DUF5131 family protein [Azospirillum argentinense]